MKLSPQHFFVILLAVGWLAATVQGRAVLSRDGRRLFQTNSASTASEDGSTSASATASGTGSASSSASSSSSSSSGGGGKSTSVAVADGDGASAISTSTKDDDDDNDGSAADALAPIGDLATPIAAIYAGIVKRIEKGEELEKAVRDEVSRGRFSIASAWGDVLGGVGLRGRGSECEDKDALVESQINDFAQALVDGLEKAKGGLSGAAEDEIKEFVTSDTEKVFVDAVNAACSIIGFNFAFRFSFAAKIVDTVSKAFVVTINDEEEPQERGEVAEETTRSAPSDAEASAIAVSTDGAPAKAEAVAISNGDSTATASAMAMSSPSGNGSPTPAEETSEEEPDAPPSVVVNVGTGNSGKCMREMSVCCLERKLLSGKCDCLLGRCDAVLEDSMWKDRSTGDALCSCT